MIDETFLSWTLVQFQIFILILVRVAAMVFMMPIIGAGSVPKTIKIGLTIATSLILLPVTNIQVKQMPDGFLSMVLLLGKEFFVGLTLSLVIKLVFAGIQFAGQMIGFQMGFGIASVMDPDMGQETPVLAELGYLISLLVFLAVNGHHLFFQSVAYSFTVLNPGEISLTPGVYKRVLAAGGDMFVIALKIMAPIMAVLFFVQVAMGIIAKAVPQMNILVVSFPITICIGLIFFGLSMHVMAPYFVRTLQETANLLPLLMRDFRGLTNG